MSFWSFGTAFGKCLGPWLGTVRLPPIFSISMWSSSTVRSVAVWFSWWSLGSFLDCVLWCHSVDYSVRSVVIVDHLRDRVGSHMKVVQYHVQNCFRRHIGTCSAWIRLGWVVIFSGAFTCSLDVRRMLGELIVLDHGVHSLALHWGACWFICRCVCHHLTPCTYHHSLRRLVNLSVGVLAITSLEVLRSCSSGTVIVWYFGTVIPLFSQSLLCRRLISYGSICNIDWKGLIRGWFQSRFVVVNCHHSCKAWDRQVWVGILFTNIHGNATRKRYGIYSVL